MKKKLLLITFILPFIVFSQQKTFNIKWQDYKTISNEAFTIEVPSFNAANFNYSLEQGLQFVAQWKINNLVNESSITLSNISYSTITKSELKGVDLNTIPSQIKYSLDNSIARDKRYAYLIISPIINENGIYKKINAFTVNYNTKNKSVSRNSYRREITNSVLNSGEWHKFYVDTTGVFKITKNFLNSIGVNTNGVDPRNIKLFGNGGEMIPYSNSEFYPMDLTENAIRVVGENDGQFDDGDYILFYAVGPRGYNEESNTNINIYTDKTYYYINTSPGQGKRVQPFIQPTGPADIEINQFQEYQFAEIDEYSLAFVGRRWFGDKFGFENTKTYEFDFPDKIDLEPIKLKAIFASDSPTASNIAIEIKNVGQLVNPPPAPPVYTAEDEIRNLLLAGASSPNYATENWLEYNPIILNSTVTLNVTFDNGGNPSANAYLDYISVEATRALNYSGNQFTFRNYETAERSGIGRYNVTNTADVSEIWDITDIYNATTVVNTDESATMTFTSTLGTLKEYVIITESDFYEPQRESNASVQNQNIKGTIFLNESGVFQDIDYLIVAPAYLEAQAERLAQLNRDQHGLNVKVQTLDKIYTEFSSGNQDIGAIRNLVKYIYDNASTPNNRIKYLCLFGDSSFDYKDRLPNNTNIVPSWHAYDSYNLTSSFVSDDFYGMMDTDEGDMNVANKLDVAVGRILANNNEQAKELVDKIISYYSDETYGSWRNNVVYVSDDVDESWERVIQETSDIIANNVTDVKPFFNAIKIHSDSYLQESSAGGDRYPKVNEAMRNAIENGALVVNYFGHGGEDGLAAERIFEKPDAEEVGNVCKLNCFVTVTCEYTRFDNPLRPTAGEYTFWNPKGGAVGLITTTRQIFVSVGISFNTVLGEYLFSLNDSDNFEYPTMAEALRLTKNDPAISNIGQRRLVFFIGDPAMKLAFPKPNIRLTKINDVPIEDETDTLEALSYVKLSGEVTDLAGNVLTDYNGILSATIYDKEIDRSTLANDNTRDGGVPIILEFKTLGETIFRGQASVTNGLFDVDFIVPRDIGIPVGFGKASFYAKSESPLQDQTGANLNTIKIGGINEDAPEDNTGPLVTLFMNDESFVSGGITNESPTLLARLEDENGINTSSGIGHDLVAIIDGDETNPYVLNDYYQTEVDNYKKGLVTFLFRDLEPGLHTLSFKAWDVYNNSSIQEIQFVVYDEDETLVVNKVLNYPNPFVNYTEFWFNHNSSEQLDISVQIFTVSGKLVRTINGKTSNGAKVTSSLSRDIVWDGRDDFGDKIGKGVYVYKLTVRSNILNKKVEKIEKLVIL